MSKNRIKIPTWQIISIVILALVVLSGFYKHHYQGKLVNSLDSRLIIMESVDSVKIITADKSVTLTDSEDVQRSINAFDSRMVASYTPLKSQRIKKHIGNEVCTIEFYSGEDIVLSYAVKEYSNPETDSEYIAYIDKIYWEFRKVRGTYPSVYEILDTI